MGLQSFLDRVDVSQTELADTLGMCQSRISDIALAKVDPRLSEVLAIQRWAKVIAKRKKLRKAERLSWSYLEK